MSENRRKVVPEWLSQETLPKIGESRGYSARDSASKEAEQTYSKKSQRIFMANNDMFDEQLEEVQISALGTMPPAAHPSQAVAPMLKLAEHIESRSTSLLRIEQKQDDTENELLHSF